ncbi:MAG TPA: hypothetical protein DCY89_08200, partial [Gammaproteobacteria bacterium]|nr:hypothetical protein [Gammaproteobacteria bacterium]
TELAFIDRGSANPIITVSAAGQVAAAIVSTEDLLIAAGASLTLGDPGIDSSIDARLTLNGGTFSTASDLAVRELVMSGRDARLDGAGDVTVATQFTWSGSGDILGAGTLFTTGTTTIGAVDPLGNGHGIGRDWINRGTATVISSGAIDWVVDGKTVSNDSGAVFNLNGSASTPIGQASGPGGQFSNRGTLNANGSGTKSVGAVVAFENTAGGVVNVTGGTFRVAGALTQAGLIRTATTGTFQRDGGFLNEVTGVLAGDGSFNVGAGTLVNEGTISPDATPLVADHGSLTILGNLLDQGTLAIQARNTPIDPVMDVIAVSGSATLNGSIVFTTTNAPAPNATFTFLTAAGGVSGNLTSLPTDYVFEASGTDARLRFGIVGDPLFQFDNEVGDGLWHNPLNWLGDFVPTLAARVDLASGFSITLDLGRLDASFRDVNGSYTLAGLESAGSNLLVTGSGLLTVTGLTRFAPNTTFTAAGDAHIALTGAADFSTFRIQDNARFVQVGDRLAAGVLPSFIAVDFQFAGGHFLRAASGDDRVGIPWQIADVYGLQGMASRDLLDDAFILANHIEAGSTLDWNGGAGFRPVGSATGPFTGSLDGAGFTIRDLVIDRPGEDQVGLIGTASGAFVSRLTLRDARMTGRDLVGAIIGSSDQATSRLSQVVVVNSQVRGDHVVGGLAGARTDIENQSRFSGEITGVQALGGLIGRDGRTSNSHYDLDAVRINGGPLLTQGALYANEYADWIAAGGSLSPGDYFTFDPTDGAFLLSTPGHLRQLLAFIDDGQGATFRLTNDIDMSTLPGWHLPRLNDATLAGNGFAIIGVVIDQPMNDNLGLVGWLDFNAEIQGLAANAVNVNGNGNVGGLVGLSFGRVLDSSSSGNVRGAVFVGGLVGQNAGTGNTRIERSSSSANVTGAAAGGLVGANLDQIRDSFATGSVTGTGFEAAGLVANNSGIIETSYSSGRVSGSGDLQGLVGVNTGTVRDAYWDVSAAGQATSAGGIGLTPAEMRSAASFAGFDFASVWTIEEGVAPPTLGPGGIVDRCVGFVCFDNGGLDFRWDNPLNWSLNLLPGANDTVRLTLPGTVLLDFDTEIAGLFVGLGSALSIEAGSLSVTGLIDIDGRLTVQEASLIAHGNAGNAGELTLQDAELHVRNGNQFSNVGRLVLNGNSLIRLPDEGGYGRFVNHAGGHLVIDSTASWSFLSDPGVQGGIIENSGRIEVLRSTSWEAAFSQRPAGRTELAPGVVVSSQRTEEIAGTLALGAGSRFLVSEARGLRHLNGLSAEGSGSLELLQDVRATDLTLRGVRLVNQALLQAEGTLDNGGAIDNAGTLAFDSDGSVTNLTGPGTLTNSNPTARISVTDNLVNRSTIVYGDGNLQLNAGARFVNEGVFRVTTDARHITGPGTFENGPSGRVEVADGVFFVSPFRGRYEGTLALGTGATLFTFGADIENAGWLTGNGAVDLRPLHLGAVDVRTGLPVTAPPPPGTFVNNGTIAPGTSPGTLTIFGNFTQT